MKMWEHSRAGRWVFNTNEWIRLTANRGHDAGETGISALRGAKLSFQNPFSPSLW